MAEPQRKIPARKPTVLEMRKYLVRLWEVERKKGSTPAQIRGFDVEANAIHKAQSLVRFELESTRRRVVRSLSMSTDGVFVAVVFKGEQRVDAPRDFKKERSAIATSRVARRAKAKTDEKARVINLQEAREKAAKKRHAAIAESRKKFAAQYEQERKQREKAAVVDRAERQLARDKARGRRQSKEG